MTHSQLRIKAIAYTRTRAFTVQAVWFSQADPAHLHHVTNASRSGRHMQGAVGMESTQVDNSVPINVLTGPHSVTHSIGRDVGWYRKLNKETVHCVISVQFINPLQEVPLRR